MRIVTWNCRQGLDRKIDVLLGLACDVAVVPECSAAPTLASQPGVSFAWTGDNSAKGLGVFGFNGSTLTPLPGPEMPWLLPLSVSKPGYDPISLLAVWTTTKLGGSYAGQVKDIADGWASRLGDRLVMAGDFNASAQGPSWKPHIRNMDRLADLGMVSAYHYHRGSEHGDESDMTLRWIGPGKTRYEYHCDFVMVSHDLAARIVSVEVGSMSEWVDAGLSDHCPVIVEFRDDPSEAACC